MTDGASKLRRQACVLAILLGAPTAAVAHEVEPHNWPELWRAWTFEPLIIAALLLTGALYVRGVRRLWSQSHGRGVRPWETACFAAGWMSLILALLSPLHAWGNALFSAHMTQHEILMLIAAPLLVLGRPLVPFLKGLPRGWGFVVGWLASRSGLGKVWTRITHPFVAWLIHAAALWLWHVPVLFQATLKSEFVHALQHSSFLFSALLFWWAVIHGRQRLLGYGAAVLYMFTTAMHSGLLGALITFARAVVYPAYNRTAGAWGLTPLEDQQLGGLIMWIPAGLVYVIAGLALFAGWLRESELRARKREETRTGNTPLTLSRPARPTSS